MAEMNLNQSVTVTAPGRLRYHSSLCPPYLSYFYGRLTATVLDHRETVSIYMIYHVSTCFTVFHSLAFVFL